MKNTLNNLPRFKTALSGAPARGNADILCEGDLVTGDGFYLAAKVIRDILVEDYGYLAEWLEDNLAVNDLFTGGWQTLISLESGFDWPIEASEKINEKLRNHGLWSEPYSMWAVGIYPLES